MKKLIVVLSVIISVVAISAEDLSQLDKIQQSQDMAVDVLFTSLKKAVKGDNNAAVTASLASATVVMSQAAETNLYHLAVLRAKAPQMITQVPFEKALTEAKAYGVSSSQLKHLKTDWAVASSIEEAHNALHSVQGLSAHKFNEAGDASATKKLLPAWMGGVSSYANYKTKDIGSLEVAGR